MTNSFNVYIYMFASFAFGTTVCFLCLHNLLCLAFFFNFVNATIILDLKSMHFKYIHFGNPSRWAANAFMYSSKY